MHIAQKYAIGLAALMTGVAFAILSPHPAAAQGFTPIECHQDRDTYEDLPRPFVFYFDTGVSTLSAAQKSELSDIAARGQNMREICVVGQADKQGNADFNRRLSLARANAVADELARLGIARDVMTIGYRGETFGGLQQQATPSKADRRVEVIFLR